MYKIDSDFKINYDILWWNKNHLHSYKHARKLSYLCVHKLSGGLGTLLPYVVIKQVFFQHFYFLFIRLPVTVPMVTVSGDICHSYNFCLIWFPICFISIKRYDNCHRFILYYVVFNVLGINGNWMLYTMNTNVFNNRFIELRTINACLLIIRKECGNYRFKIKYAVVILILD